MGVPCSICVHPEREAIDHAIVSGLSVRGIACQWHVGRESVRRHGINHISPALAAMQAQREEQGAATREIARNVSEASKGTQEVSSNISGVAQAAGETGRGASETLSAANNLGTGTNITFGGGSLSVISATASVIVPASTTITTGRCTQDQP